MESTILSGSEEEVVIRAISELVITAKPDDSNGISSFLEQFQMQQYLQTAPPGIPEVSRKSTDDNCSAPLVNEDGFELMDPPYKAVLAHPTTNFLAHASDVKRTSPRSIGVSGGVESPQLQV